MFDKLKYLRPKNWGKLVGEGRLVMALMRDPQVPVYLKALPVVAVAYAIFPDPFGVIPLIGQLDDITILMGLSAVFLRFAPTDVVDAHRMALNLDPVA